MKKKTLTIVLALALLAIAIVGVTLAYFTDTESAENTFTVGKVDIELLEHERYWEDDDVFLQDFTDDKVLMPIVGSAQGPKDRWGMPLAEIYGDKIIRVKNLESDAYVRVYVAVPEALVDSDASKAPLHANYGNRFDPKGEGRFNTPGGQGTWNPDFLNWDWDAPFVPVFSTEIDGIDYSVGVYTYKEVLSKNEVTGAPCLVGFYLDSRIDYDHENDQYFIKYADDDIKVLDFDFTEPINIPVFAVGVQADGFDDAEAAFNAALPANYNPWG
jgi:predicted ribosomally synthesized peptide with SipW-like signal peptide